MNRKRIISPSMLSADFLRLGEEVELINRSDAEWIHLDVMDGSYVPNISFGIPVVKAISSATEKVSDCHLMIEHPDRYVREFALAGTNILTVHYEACTHLHRTLQQIHDEGLKAGIALNPHTPIELLRDILPDADLILIMSVNPGFGGQKFISQALDKVSRLRTIIDKEGYDCLIEVDGGVNDTTAPLLWEAGADVLVAGSYVFGSPDPEGAITRLLQ